MSEFRDQIPAAGGKVEFFYHKESGGIDTQISGFGFIAMYLIAVSMDGRELLGTVPASGIGQTVVYPKPSIVTYIQSDEQGLWGRNCPFCEKYFRTNHVMGTTCCPYCAAWAPSLAFISKQQRIYITAFYDAFARAYNEKRNTSLSEKDITDNIPAWHYSEEKQQLHFECNKKDCHAATDILGEYGYCPQCGQTNARTVFLDKTDKMLRRFEETYRSITDRHARAEVWASLTVGSISEFEPLAKHLRTKLLRFPLTSERRRRLEELNFQKPFEASEFLRSWFDVGLFEWVGNDNIPKRVVAQSDFPFIKKMIQKRHILIHNGGVVDQEYLDLSGDTQARLNERIRIKSQEAKRFVECIRTMAVNLHDNVEYGFSEA